jgi:hypothetical protein
MRGGWALFLASTTGVAVAWSCGGAKTSVSSGADSGAQDGAPVDGTVGCGASGQACCDGTACNNGLTCTGGTCVAPCGAAGEACCNGSACDNGLACAGGTCSASTDGGAEASPPPTDAGTDTTPPADGGPDAYVDAAGCGGANEPCCGSGTCGSGFTCAFGSCQTCATFNCGAINQACCCSETPCSDGWGCSQGTCSCGQLGNVCCSEFGGLSCNSSLTVCSDAGLCAPCGGAGEPCCVYADPTCAAPLACQKDSGTCQ